MIQAKRHQIAHFGFADAHDGVRTAPIDLDRSIGLRDGAAGEHDVVDIPSDFARSFRLQDPRVAHADDSGGVLQIVKRDAQPVDGT